MLEWEFRAPLVLREILESEADVLCLQELNHFGKWAGGPRAGRFRRPQRALQPEWSREMLLLVSYPTMV